MIVVLLLVGLWYRSVLVVEKTCLRSRILMVLVIVVLAGVLA